jgi:hypothetical protein
VLYRVVPRSLRPFPVRALIFRLVHGTMLGCADLFYSFLYAYDQLGHTNLDLSFGSRH